MTSTSFSTDKYTVINNPKIITEQGNKKTIVKIRLNHHTITNYPKIHPFLTNSQQNQHKLQNPHREKRKKEKTDNLQ